MVVELYRTRDCNIYNNSVKPNRPTLTVVAETFLTRTRVPLEAVIDTGFSGYLLLPQEKYSELSESELLSDYFLTYNTILGPVQLKRSPVVQEIAGKRMSSFVETPVVGAGKTLAGRRILAELRIALLGPEARACILDEYRNT
jgi:predicted aspartyl protease